MKSKNSIEITSRDIDFFCYIHSVKVATIEQIGRDCYTELAKPGLYKRLLRLEKKRMIQGSISSSSGGRKVYSITRKSFKSYVQKEEVKRCELKSDAIKHDIGLIDIRHILLQSKFVKKYVPENTLQTFLVRVQGEHFEPFVRNNSDAALEIVIDDTSLYFSVELELSLKNNQRYEEKISAYYLENGITRVLYILEDEASINSMMKLEKKLDKKKRAKFFYTTFDKLVQKKDRSFINWKKEKIVL